IVGGRAPCPLGHAEGGKGRPVRALVLKELGIDRIGARIAALDIVDTQVLKQADDGNLVLKRELDAGRLGAVAQGGVEEVEAVFGHEATFLCCPARPAASLACRGRDAGDWWRG